MAGGASGHQAFTLLLRLLVTLFDGVGTEEGYTKLHDFGMCNGTTFSDFSREFRVLVPSAPQSRLGPAVGADQGPPSAYFSGAPPPTKGCRLFA